MTFQYLASLHRDFFQTFVGQLKTLPGGPQKSTLLRFLRTNPEAVNSDRFAMFARGPLLH